MKSHQGIEVIHELELSIPQAGSAYSQASRGGGQAAVPTTAMADPGIYFYWLCHILFSEKQPSGRLDGDREVASLQQRTDRGYARADGDCVWRWEVCHGNMVGPKQSPVLHALGIGVDRDLQFRICGRQQLPNAPGVVDIERVSAGNGMGSVRTLPGSLVQYSREGHGFCILEHCSQRWGRTYRPDCGLQHSITRMAFGVLCSGHSGNPVRNLSFIAT